MKITKTVGIKEWIVNYPKIMFEKDGTMSLEDVIKMNKELFDEGHDLMVDRKYNCISISSIRLVGSEEMIINLEPKKDVNMMYVEFNPKDLGLKSTNKRTVIKAIENYYNVKIVNAYEKDSQYYYEQLMPNSDLHFFKFKNKNCDSNYKWDFYETPTIRLGAQY